MVTSHGDQVATTTANVTDPDDMAAATNLAVSTWGGLDITVLGAGTEGRVANIEDDEMANFDNVMAVNVRGVWLGLKYAIAAMKETSDSGSIIALSSNAGLAGAPGSAVYAASKHAVIGLVRSAAAEVGADGIRVNAVCPSPIEGRMIQSLERGYAPNSPERVHKNLERKIPLGRYGQPDEVSAMISFLVSDDAGFCTGEAYMVDGGKTAL